MRALRSTAALAIGLLIAASGHAQALHIYAHRGDTRRAPENSLAACRAAFSLGASCEVDVRRTRDGELVLMHDATVARTTNGRGRIARLTLGDLRSLALDGGRTERVPTLAETLALPRGGRALLLDLKQDDAVYRARLARTLSAESRAGEIVLGVRSGEQARALRAALPRHDQVALIEAPAEIEALAAAGVETIRLKLAWLARDAQLAARVRSTSARLLVLVERGGARELERALAYEPDALLCDDAETALALVRDRAAAAGGP